MFSRKRWRALHETLAAVERRLDQLERHHDHVRTILLVQNPGSPGAADAYDGLRKQVVSAVSERLAHLTQLVQLDAALTREPGHDVLFKLVDGWCEQSALLRVTDPARPDADLLFETVEDLGGPAVVLSPAYVDGLSGRVIRQGRIRHTASEAAPTKKDER